MIQKFDSPHEAVFICKVGKGGRVLFKGQSQLADEIINHKEGGFQDKSVLTVRSALSQIFNGERNLSKNLKHVLFLVIKDHFNNDKYDYIEFEKLLLEKFKAVYAERATAKKERNPDRDYDTLIEATEKGENFLITTLEPAELHKSEMADRLKNQLLEKTEIIKPISDEVVNANYKFYFPIDDGDLIAREFWEELKRNAIEVYGENPAIVDSKLQEANESGKILTFLAPKDIAMHPYVFINYDDRFNRTGFCVSYRNREIPSVAELSLKVVREWFAIYYKRIIEAKVINDSEALTDEKLLKNETKEIIINFRYKHT